LLRSAAASLVLRGW
jgi:hypothetical protein